MHTARLAATLLASSALAAAVPAVAGAQPAAAGGSVPARSALKSLADSARVPTVPFATEYDAEGYYGAVKCKGKHETNANAGYPGSASEGGRDVERCKSTTGMPLIGLAPGETVALGAGWFPGSSGWNSDYDGQAATSIEYVVSANGRSFKLVAYYPFAG
ncbi:MAG TPA: hypothetical protein VK790_06735 [Solirubrobacteraceae bacterium]|nr:hypothetical protein [Solirubrobacteraceae bacterium]